MNELTESDIRTLFGIATGKSRSQIAKDEGISVFGVNRRLKVICSKLGANETVHAVSLAHAGGLFTPDKLHKIRSSKRSRI